MDADARALPRSLELMGHAKGWPHQSVKRTESSHDCGGQALFCTRAGRRGRLLRGRDGPRLYRKKAGPDERVHRGYAGDTGNGGLFVIDSKEDAPLTRKLYKNRIKTESSRLNLLEIQMKSYGG